VLFVDDDHDLRDTMRDTLEFLGAGPSLMAGSLEELTATLPDLSNCRLAILDVNLGVDKPNGVDVFQWLTKRGYQGSVVFLTGHGADDPRVVAAAGISGTRLIKKPLDFDAVARLVAKPAPQP
jgi:DNA-binding NtrC family response regulator